MQGATLEAIWPVDCEDFLADYRVVRVPENPFAKCPDAADYEATVGLKRYCLSSDLSGETPSPEPPDPIDPSAKAGDCVAVSGVGMVVNEVRKVDCGDPEADYRVVLVKGAGYSCEAPADTSITIRSAMAYRTFCLESL